MGQQDFYVCQLQDTWGAASERRQHIGDHCQHGGQFDDPGVSYEQQACHVALGLTLMRGIVLKYITPHSVDDFTAAMQAVPGCYKIRIPC